MESPNSATSKKLQRSGMLDAGVERCELPASGVRTPGLESRKRHVRSGHVDWCCVLGLALRVRQVIDALPAGYCGLLTWGCVDDRLQRFSTDPRL